MKNIDRDKPVSSDTETRAITGLPVTDTHTPGPWAAVDDEIVALNSDINIADVRLSDGINPSEWQANLRLIASAPDMLEVLAALDAWTKTNSYLDNHSPVLCRHMRAALAKAEGRP